MLEYQAKASLAVKYVLLERKIQKEVQEANTNEKIASFADTKIISTTATEYGHFYTNHIP